MPKTMFVCCRSVNCVLKQGDHFTKRVRYGEVIALQNEKISRKLFYFLQHGNRGNPLKFLL
jgi:hypothetical protein